MSMLQNESENKYFYFVYLLFSCWVEKHLLQWNYKSFLSSFYRVEFVSHACTKVTNATDLKCTSQLEFYRNFIITMNYQIKK
jgi:hypothetical protein